MARARGMTKKQRDIIEAQDWSISECDYANGGKGFEFEKYSPAGEDFIFSVEANNPRELVEGIKEYAADFSPDEHIEMWVIARCNGSTGIPSIRELVEDADAIDKMLQELAAALADT